MNKTKIEWCSHTWNPVTGCFHGCPYCYARGIARRFGGHTDILHAAEHQEEYEGEALHDLESPLVNGETKAAYPFGFEPTMHRYRLNQPERVEEPRTVFVCSMSDLFGKWVPLSWIRDVLDACQRAPQHRYLFLTKNPARYLELDHLALLPHGENFWYGSTATNPETSPMAWAEEYHTFVSIEPLLGPLGNPRPGALHDIDWIIVGAETGNRKNKVVPRREWVDQITAFCAENDIPVFYKDNLRAYFPDLPASEFPWDPF